MCPRQVSCVNGEKGVKGGGEECEGGERVPDCGGREKARLQYVLFANRDTEDG